MENVRIAVLDTYDQVLCHMDNSAPGALHYYDDELHMYLKGSAHTFSFKVSADHEDSEHITVGHKLAFVYNGKDYYLNVVKAFESETEIEVTAFSLSFELLNDSPEEYEAAAAMTFEEYMEIFDTEKCVEIGLNELPSASKRMGKFKEETLLSRIFSLAELFEVEAEFIPILNNNYSLKKVVLNIYREHSFKYQGIGKNRTDIVLRYGKGVTGIRKSLDISELFTAIRPYGKAGLTLESLWDMQVKDAAGNIEFEHLEGEKEIRAVQARGRFPSNLISKDRYITIPRDYDDVDQLALYQDALNDLKDGCVPRATYEIEGYFDTGIGDTISVEDSEFNPPLYLTARVTEQIVSFTDMKRNKSVFSNIKEEKSQISQTMIKKMQEMIKESMIANTTYKMTVDAAAIKQSESKYVPETINVSAYTQSGTELTPYMAFFTVECLEKSWYTALEVNRETISYTPPTDRVIDAIRISMYEYDSYAAGDGILLDQTIIPVINIASEEVTRGVSILCAVINGSDTTLQIPYTSIVGEYVPNVGDVILTINGYLFGVTGRDGNGAIVKRLGVLGNAGDSGIYRLFCSTASAEYDSEMVGYDTILPTNNTPLAGDVILCVNGTLMEVKGQGHSGFYTTYITGLGTDGKESRGNMLFFCMREGQNLETTLLYAYDMNSGEFDLQQGDLILTVNGKLYMVESANSYNIHVTFIQTLYA